MAISITSIVDNGDGTATLTWAGAAGTVSVELLVPPSQTFGAVGGGSGGTGSTAPFAAPPGLNWCYVVDVSGLNTHTAGPVMLVMDAVPGALPFTIIGGISPQIAEMRAADVRVSAMDFTEELGENEIIVSAAAVCSTATIATVQPILYPTTINGNAVAAGQAMQLTVSVPTIGLSTITVTVNTTCGQTLTATIKILTIP